MVLHSLRVVYKKTNLKKKVLTRGERGCEESHDADHGKATVLELLQTEVSLLILRHSRHLGGREDEGDDAGLATLHVVRLLHLGEELEAAKKSEDLNLAESRDRRPLLERLQLEGAERVAGW